MDQLKQKIAMTQRVDQRDRQIAIQTRGLRKEYDKVVALHGLDLEIPEGEIYGLVGPNGAGKTTLLNILSTALRPDCGLAYVAGADIEKDPLEVRRRMGYMPDFFSLYDNMTSEDFLTYFGLAFGVDKNKLPDRVSELLCEVDLEDKREARIKDLSRGMRQRLMFVKTLVHDPEALLLDEPLSGLDPLARMEMREIMRDLGKHGKTVVISSHILTELSEFCTMVGILEHGRLKVSGKIDEVLARFKGERMVTLETLSEGARAREIVAGIEGASLEPGEGETIKFRCAERETIAMVNTALVNEGIQVVSLAEHKGDIEDIYFKVAAHEVS